MRGISFRFSDLRYLFFCASEQASKKKKKTHNIVVPKVQDLQINFRSHTGVLNLAASIIDVMKKYFPNSFDRLPGDKGMFTGPMPIVIESSNFSDLALIMQTNKRESSKKIEFGAHQVIIVQSEKAKQDLPDVLKSSIVLTVFESKGLEFDDVLLFNFFKDSQVLTDDWRVVTAYINDEEGRHCSTVCKDESPFPKSRPLIFDDSQHKSLNSELKYLYTAITRARCNLWIYDSDELKRRPVFDYWYRRGLIKVIRVDEVTEQDESTLFASTSSSEEWKIQGNQLKKKQLWEPAMKCYQKAQCKSLELEAHAYSLILQAQRQSPKSKKAQELYLHAAKSFLDSNEIEHSLQCIEYAAKCLTKAKKYDVATDLFVLLRRNNKALKYFQKTKDYSVLAEIKENMGKPNDAICILLKHGMIIKALECASKHENEVLPCYKKEHIAHKYAQKCISDEQSTEKLQAFLKYLPSIEQVRYLKTGKLYTEACQILADENKTDEVYELCKAQGWFDKGLELAQKQKNSDEKTIFMLYKATKELERNHFTTETTDMLSKNYGRHTENENRCMLLLGMIKRNHEMLHNVRSYYHKNVIAHLEVLNIATAHAEYDNNKHCWNNIYLNTQEDLVITILNACHSAEIINAMLEDAQDINSPLIASIESFYGFQRDHSGMYLMPESSYPWTNELLRVHIPTELTERNLEGMLKVEFSIVMKGVCNRLKEFCHKWILEDNLRIVEVLCIKIKRFSYHEQIMNNRGYLKESCLAKLDKRAHLQAYLELLGSLFQAKEWGNANIPFDVIQLTLHALSPQATCYLQVKQENDIKPLKQMPSLVLSVQLSKLFYSRAKEIVNADDKKFNIDKWLETWRIMSVTKYGTHEMTRTLLERTNKMSHAIKVQEVQSADFPQYVYHIKSGEYNHLIFVWVDVCDKIKRKKMYAASTSCVHNFILPIASSPSLWETVSVSNFLNIATIQLVAILMMINICSIHSRQPGNMYIPQSYMNEVNIFLIMTHSDDLLHSCYEDMRRSRKEALPELKNKLVRLMHFILKAVIGTHNVAHNLLKKATLNHECLENYEAEHSLIFVLTLLANMSLIDSVPDTELQSLQQQICDSIKQCDKPIIQQSYQNLLASSTANNFFTITINLLQNFRDSLQCLNIHFSQAYTRAVYTTKQAKTNDILSHRRLLTLSHTLTKDTDKANRIAQFKLRPSAPVFLPSWKKSTSNAGEKPTQPVSSSNENTTPDNIDITLSIQDISEENVEEESANDFNAFMKTNGICQICASTIHFNLKDDDSISAKTAMISEHCSSEKHQNKLEEHKIFSSEIEVYKANKKHLSDLVNKCNEQYNLHGQYHVLKEVIDQMNQISKEYEKELKRIHDTAEWREGISQMETIGGKIRSLTMRGERELKISKDMKLKLDREQEEQDKQEDKEQEEVDSDMEEDIPLADPNSGYAAKKKKRAKKRRAKTK